MEIKKINEPKFQLTLSTDEMSKLWKLLYDADYQLLQNASYFYRKLEDVRPAGGFTESR